MTDPILITGATGALGRAVVQALAASGKDVIPIDRSAPPEDFPGADRAITLDLSDRDAVIKALGGIPKASGLVCVVGGFTMGPKVWEIDPTDMDGMASINIATMLNTVAGALSALRAAEHASIVTIGAGAGLLGEGGAGMGAYAASKAAVIRLTQTLAADLAGTHITANAVLPSIIDTPANRNAMPDASRKNWVAPADLAAVIAFLLSPAARAVSGVALPVTRGTALLPPAESSNLSD